MNPRSYEKLQITRDSGRAVGIYLARYFTTYGFTPNIPPEARPLAAACDVVLIRATPGSIDIVCPLDRDIGGREHFDLTPQDLLAIGAQCLKYCGPAGKKPPQVRLHVVGIGAGMHERDRLQGYAGSAPSQPGPIKPGQVTLCAWAVDKAAGWVWTNAPASAQFVPSQAIESAMKMPHATAADIARAIETWRIAAACGRSTAYLTYALLAVLVAAFAGEIVFAVDPAPAWTPSVRSLVADGALSSPLVRAGQWFRILTAPFLHANPFHLVMNALVLLFAGRMLEGHIGTAWFATVYLVGALGGSLGSLLINPVNMVSVGASGAIMGVLAAMWVCGFRFPSGPQRSRLQLLALQVLIPSLLPIATAVAGTRVDFAAHIGGAVGGALVGLAIIGLWPALRVLPRLQWLAATVAALGLVALATALPRLYLAGLLIPEADVPISDVGQSYQAPKLVARYPRDPRAHLFQGVAFISTGDLAGAERELRADLAETYILKTALKPAVDMQLRANLALVLLRRQRADEARSLARPVCQSGDTDMREIRARLAQLHLCE